MLSILVTITMVITRSREAGQKKLEDFIEPDENVSQQGDSHNKPRKRNTQPINSVQSPAKKSKKSISQDSPQAQKEEPAHEIKKESSAKSFDSEGEEDQTITLKKSDDTDEHSESIKINRAPVLNLFASVSAQLEHPDLSWETCLSLGSAVASICAISKGRSIGKIPESNADQPSKHKKDQKVSVLGFEIPVKEGLAYVGDQKKPPDEQYLKRKFGERFDEVKQAMSEAVNSWKGHEEEFAKKGFHMYEKFRPGGGKWGAQGGLDIKTVQREIMR